MRNILPFALLIAVCVPVGAQELPVLPYKVDPGFFKLPEDWNFEQTPGVAVNSSGGIYVYTRMKHALLEFDSVGNFVRELAPGLFETPHGLRVDDADNIWVTDLARQQVLKLDPDGRILMVLGIKGAAGTMLDSDGLIAPVFDKPTDVAFDRYGSIYVSDGYGNSRIVKFDADGRFIKAWGELGSEPGNFNLPHSILVDARDRVWVADRNNQRVQLFDLDGDFLEEWTHVGWPWGFAHASDGNVWLADGTNNVIKKLSLDGSILGMFGEPGKHPGQLGWVHYLDEANDGSILVAEIVNQRAQRFLKASGFGLAGAQTPTGGDYLFAWAADADGKDSDFLAVIDANRASPRYGSLVTTLQVGAKGTHPHHTEHRMPRANVLFANGFSGSKTFLIDLNDSAAPQLVASFDSAGRFTFPHSFERLPNGNVLATFQTTGKGNRRPGGLVELGGRGEMIRSSPASNDVENVRPYSLVVLPEIDRVVSTSTDMKGDIETRGIQIWRLSDLTLLHTLLLPDGGRGGEGMTPGEPRMAPDGSVIVTTFRCGMYRVSELEGDNPDVQLVHAYPYVSGYECALPVTIGRFVVQTVPAINGLIAMDVTDPANPQEVDRLSFGPGAHPHWIASSDDGRRIVMTGYRALNGRVFIIDFDPDTGKMSLDEDFRDDDSIFPGVSLLRDEWPHGITRDAIPHGVVFSH